MKHTLTRIPTSGRQVKSLVWSGDNLVDWASGRAVYGSSQKQTLKIDDRFDSASVSPSGRFIAVYDRYGTEAVLFKDGVECRRLTRATYHAADYDYPLCFIPLPSGREAVAHCPKEYNKISIEDAETGEDIGFGLDKLEEDFFHSRLAYDDDSGWLMSAGWIWHPLDSLRLFDLRSTTPQPINLVDWNCISSAAFLGGGRLAAAVTFEDLGLYEEEDKSLPLGSLCVFDIDSRKMTDCIEFGRELGTIFSIGEGRILCLYGHPFLIGLDRRSIVAEWPDIVCEVRNTSINPRKPQPISAVDCNNSRFAVVQTDEIVVVTISPD